MGWIGLGWVGLDWVGLDWVGVGWDGLALALGWVGLGFFLILKATKRSYRAILWDSVLFAG